MALLESGEMYLETIYILSQTSSAVHPSDVSEYMNYSRPSVTRAIGILKQNGLVIKDEFGHLKLTENGNEIAKRIYERHTVLSSLLISLGVSEKTAAEDACRIEHYISDETFEKMKEHLEKYGGTPADTGR